MNKKLVEFIKRNKKRNQPLYAPNTIQGYDYVVCPVSGERLSMIKDNYITNVLGLACRSNIASSRLGILETSQGSPPHCARSFRLRLQQG